MIYLKQEEVIVFQGVKQKKPFMNKSKI